MAVSSADRAWFAEQVESLLPELFGTALRLTRNRTDAEDLVADAVAKAWIGLDSLQQRDALRGWLFRILTNAFLSGLRSAAARVAHEPFDEEAGEGAPFSLFARLHQPFLLWWGNPERVFLDKLLPRTWSGRSMPWPTRSGLWWSWSMFGAAPIRKSRRP